MKRLREITKRKKIMLPSALVAFAIMYEINQTSDNIDTTLSSQNTSAIERRLNQPMATSTIDNHPQARNKEEITTLQNITRETVTSTTLNADDQIALTTSNREEIERIIREGNTNDILELFENPNITSADIDNIIEIELGKYHGDISRSILIQIALELEKTSPNTLNQLVYDNLERIQNMEGITDRDLTTELQSLTSAFANDNLSTENAEMAYEMISALDPSNPLKGVMLGQLGINRSLPPSMYTPIYMEVERRFREQMIDNEGCQNSLTEFLQFEEDPTLIAMIQDRLANN